VLTRMNSVQSGPGVRKCDGHLVQMDERYYSS
jgi:hypothetical protein